MKTTMTSIALLGLIASTGAAGTLSMSNYDDLSEGFYGNSFSYNGVNYNQVNNVDGVFPDGSTFTAGGGITGLGDEIIVENATLLYNDFPGFGSGPNGLTFGSAFIPGDNLSLGAISTVTMSLDQNANFASLDMAYFENGPWGGIVYHLDAFNRGDLVASDSFTIAGGGDRDNIAFATLSVDGAEFDTLQLYATFGNDFTAPRILLDNLTLNTVPAPSALALLGAGGLLGARRRR
jgi:hypothetical protein